MFEANLGGVFRLYRAALARCWLPSLLLALTWGGVATILDRRLGPADDLLQWLVQVQALLWSAYFWRLLVLASGLSVFFYCAMVADIHAVAVGGAAPAAAGLASALHAFPGALIAAVIFLMATSMATMLFVVPGAYLWGMWQLWLIVLVVEHTGPLAALRRSWQLVAGSWWRITTLVTIVTVMSAVPPLMVDALLGGSLALVGVDAARAPALLTIAGGLLNIFLLPLIPAALVAAYLDRQRAAVLQG